MAIKSRLITFIILCFSVILIKTQFGQQRQPGFEDPRGEYTTEATAIHKLPDWYQFLAYGDSVNSMSHDIRWSPEVDDAVRASMVQADVAYGEDNWQVQGLLKVFYNSLYGALPQMGNSRTWLLTSWRSLETKPKPHRTRRVIFEPNFDSRYHSSRTDVIRHRVERVNEYAKFIKVRPGTTEVLGKLNWASAWDEKVQSEQVSSMEEREDIEICLEPSKI